MRLVVLLGVVASMSAPALASDCKATKSAYSQLQSGMSYEDAVYIIGCEGDEISSSSMAGFTTIMYMWDGNGFAANMNAMFQNNKLVSKAQFGLK